MESDSTVITTSPLQSNDSMPPTPNSVENSSATSSPANYNSSKQIKKEVTILTNNQPIMSQSNRRRHYSSASSSADEDIAIDVVNETTNKKYAKQSNKKLNSSESTELINSNRIKLESPNNNHYSRSLNNSINGEKSDIKLSTKTNGTTITPKSTSAHTILHSPNSNSSSNSQFDTSTSTTIKAESAASLIANLDAEQASRKFKSFLIEDILSQQRKKAQEQLLHQQQKFIEQQLLLQHFNSNKLLQQHSSSTLPSLSPNTTNQSSPNSVHSLVNSNSDNLNDSMSAALAAYNSINSIIRPWDLTNGLIPNSAAAAAATLSQLTSSQQASLNASQQQSNSTNATVNLPTSHSLALTLGTNSVQTTNTSPTTQQQLNNHLNGSSSLLNNSNQLAMAAAAALASQHSPNNKLNVQQLQQLRFGSLANYPHLLPGNFAASLSHLSPHHQFLAGLNGSTASSLFPGLTANNLTNNLSANAALNAALKNDPSFRLHHPLTTHPFTNNTLLAQQQQTNTTKNQTDASLMQHLINNSTNNLSNGQQNKSSNVNNKQSKSISINENGKRLNVEDLDDDCEDYENETIVNDDDCDEKCSINSSTNGQTKKITNGTNSDGSPLSALYELANKPFELTRNEKSSENNPERMNTIFTNNGQTSKKKRKSRTAFTNSQIFQLEAKFSYQRYLTPADRDDLAEKLDLTGAQVITWFQNRRAKMKRDNEETHKDITAKMFHQATMTSPLYYGKALIQNNLPSIYENMQQKLDLFNAAKMHLHLSPSLPKQS